MTDSPDYQKRKKFYDKLLTVYGRKPVLEALEQTGIKVHRLHLAESNKPATILTDITRIAEAAGAEICYHSKQALSRISRNGKQDQGVAVDLVLEGYQHYRDFLQARTGDGHFELLALDGITNPQNLGMILRSVAASGIDGVLLPNKGCAQIDPLVIKASAGALFRCPILRCDDLAQTLGEFQQAGAAVCGLSSHAAHTLAEFNTRRPVIFVLGNETHGVSEKVQQLANENVRIEMRNGVESLNVAITASLLAFRHQLRGA
ncbi:RNA methyltransferase [Simiduia sp. 21SJ11W-1]|uniref:TrmH family RNA methyltransferase n=1 Tax=Simiduia sp. 21SJ11W-1 TaxID=2909669 RepID=UPI00209F6B42|nr:RNA methyltransferase [Simiduia sp. 21SJ11W-1]UTA49293.1 RNA methyltransferase [Simiduia sp. 21SJ11W-1]